MSAGRRRARQKIHAQLRPKRPKPKKCAVTSKRGFSSKEDALAELGNASRKKATQRVYRCEFCSRWHLTSKPQRGRQG